MKDLNQILEQKSFSNEEIIYLLGLTTTEDCLALQRAAYDRTTELLGDEVYYRGLIEISNICTVNCRYCGIRKANHDLQRYEMTKDQIVETAVWAAKQGYGSICLQAGERQDRKFIDFISECLREIHRQTISETLPEGVGVTLSLGDQERAVYREWAEASGTRNNLRYLLRIESSNQKLFNLLHSSPGRHEKDLTRRLTCLKNLRQEGYQLGTGVMIGVPGQTLEDLCQDIRLFQELDVDMIGMGPYIVSEGADMLNAGMMDSDKLLQLSLNMIAVVRLVLGPINIAAATALQALKEDGRELGIEYGCNVIMPNISPVTHRAEYQLYDNKPCLNDEPTDCAAGLEQRIIRRGRRVGWNRSGSSKRWEIRQQEM